MGSLAELDADDDDAAVVDVVVVEVAAAVELDDATEDRPGPMPGGRSKFISCSSTGVVSSPRSSFLSTVE